MNVLDIPQATFFPQTWLVFWFEMSDSLEEKKSD